MRTSRDDAEGNKRMMQHIMGFLKETTLNYKSDSSLTFCDTDSHTIAFISLLALVSGGWDRGTSNVLSESW